ncbi:MAG: UDP-galactopyranose mutase, partial [Paracoccus sp. (in: a-proteobacteria)]|nr:UDP-galactopyranose mutase [Paracoccus sp. (in: a-proteobacteria)]
YYPIRLVEEKALLDDYIQLAEAQQGVTFVGRLGTYRYLDMDVTIREAMDTARGFLETTAAGNASPVFAVSPR